ncbi:hypothetical protein D3C81_1232330 [compost metagenome]
MINQIKLKKATKSPSVSCSLITNVPPAARRTATLIEASNSITGKNLLHKVAAKIWLSLYRSFRCENFSTSCGSRANDLTVRTPVTFSCTAVVKELSAWRISWNAG